MTHASAVRELDVAVVGGGAIGLAVAWRAAQRGAARRGRSTPASPARGTSPRACSRRSPRPSSASGALLELGLRERARFPAFVRRARSDPGYREIGTLVVARDGDEAEALERLPPSATRLGLPVERLRPSQARRLEPALAPTVRLALDVPERPRGRSAHARRGAAPRASGARRRAARPACVVEGERVAGVALEDGDGARRRRSSSPPASRGALGMPERARAGPPGQGPGAAAARPRGPGLLERTIRGERAYFVPRGDGRYVLGATMEERGFDTTPTAGGVYELLRDMSEVVPGVLELEIEELIAGPAPATPDNLPAIGPGALDGAVWATGHFRNGILLTPVTADAGRRGAARASRCRSGRRPPTRAASPEVRRVRVRAQRRRRRAGRRRDGRRPRSTSLDLPGAGRGVAVAVDAEVVPRGAVGRHGVARRGAGGDPARDPGRLRWPRRNRHRV